MASLTARHPLAERASLGIEMPGATHLQLIDGARIFTIMPFRGQGKALLQKLKRSKSFSLRTVGPDDWIVVASDKVPDIDPAQALVVDQSHGRCLFRLGGPRALALLMKGVGVDLEGAFPVGSSANMLFGHISINLARIDEESFELIVMRSYAESLLHDLKLAGREFGLSFAISEG
jgi:sarcosine oxidase subunit gamma